MRWLGRTSRKVTPVAVTPEFGVRVTLRRGDRIVRRDARGVIRVTYVTEERLELTDVSRAVDGTPPSR